MPAAQVAFAFSAFQTHFALLTLTPRTISSTCSSSWLGALGPYPKTSCLLRGTGTPKTCRLVVTVIRRVAMSAASQMATAVNSLKVISAFRLRARS